MIYAGKGFGDLPNSWGYARALAVTGQIGYSVPTRSSNVSIDPDGGAAISTPNAQFIKWGGTLQYSMPYLKSSVADLSLPDFVNRLIPIVEVNFRTPAANYAGTGLITTGTVNPGVIYVADKFQIGAEAILPVNRASGTGPGAMGQVHIFLDDLFPDTIGRPLLAQR